MTWPYGAKYDGDFQNDRRNGKRTTYADQNETVPVSHSCFMLRVFGHAAFLLVGLGVYNYPDGRCYTGQYRDDRRHGVGSETAADGTILYSGNWSNGEFIDE